MIRLIVAVLLIIPSLCFGGQGMGPGPGIGRGYSSGVAYNYCVRADGSATKTNAIDCSNASSSMSVATFNTSSFADNDIIAISSRGGNFNAVSLVLPTGGSDSSNKITYTGEAGYIPTLTGDPPGNHIGVAVTVSNVVVRDIKSYGSTTSNFEFYGTASGITTHNLDGRNSTNQAFQHLNTVSVEHNNIYCTDAFDECISTHNTPTVVINGGTFDITTVGTGSHAGINWIDTPTMSVYDVTFNVLDSTAFAVTTAGAGTFVFERCVFNEHIDNNNRGVDWSFAGTNITYKNNIFKNLTDADYYIMFRTTCASAVLANNTFIGDGVNTTTAVFNDEPGTYINNIFINALTQAYYGTGGTISNNIYVNSGTARGSNAITVDPALDANGRIQTTDSSAYDVGIGPSSNANVPSNDIDKQTRTGTTCDIGADEYQ